MKNYKFIEFNFIYRVILNIKRKNRIKEIEKI